jgi:hypothetical protein
LIENGATLYSYACTKVKITPYVIVATKPFVVAKRSPAKIALCAQVIVTPEDNKITVFHKGNPHGFKEEMPKGGQTHPIPTDGDRLQ